MISACTGRWRQTSVLSPAVLLLACLSMVATAWGEAKERASLTVGAIGDWAMAGDAVTMIVSQPSSGRLVFVDTVAHREVKSIEVDFAPNRLAIQNGTLFASVRGSSIVYALDARTAKATARFKLPGEPAEVICCHAESGPVFAANLNEEIFAIDPASQSVKKTKARGTMLAIDPAEGNFLLAGTNRPGEDFIEIQEGRGVARVRPVTVANRAAVLKYAVEDGRMRLIAGNKNAAIGAGGCLAISHGGDQFAMAAGGGWRSMTDVGFHYVIAVFETLDMETMTGQIELGAYPVAIAFHPLLNLGAALRRGGTEITVKLFKSTSLTDRQVLQLDPQPFLPGSVHKLAFCGRGTSLAHHYGETLTFIPLELTDEEEGVLSEVYGNVSQAFPVVK